jgi:hypothetical protein
VLTIFTGLSNPEKKLAFINDYVAFSMYCPNSDAMVYLDSLLDKVKLLETSILLHARIVALEELRRLVYNRYADRDMPLYTKLMDAIVIVTRMNEPIPNPVCYTIKDGFSVRNLLDELGGNPDRNFVAFAIEYVKFLAACPGQEPTVLNSILDELSVGATNIDVLGMTPSDRHSKIESWINAINGRISQRPEFTSWSMGARDGTYRPMFDQLISKLRQVQNRLTAFMPKPISPAPAPTQAPAGPCYRIQKQFTAEGLLDEFGPPENLGSVDEFVTEYVKFLKACNEQQPEELDKILEKLSGQAYVFGMSPSDRHGTINGWISRIKNTISSRWEFRSFTSQFNTLINNLNEVLNRLTAFMPKPISPAPAPTQAPAPAPAPRGPCFVPKHTNYAIWLFVNTSINDFVDDYDMAYNQCGPMSDEFKQIDSVLDEVVTVSGASNFLNLTNMDRQGVFGKILNVINWRTLPPSKTYLKNRVCPLLKTLGGRRSDCP